MEAADVVIDVVAALATADVSGVEEEVGDEPTGVDEGKLALSTAASVGDTMSTSQ